MNGMKITDLPEWRRYTRKGGYGIRELEVNPYLEAMEGNATDRRRAPQLEEFVRSISLCDKKFNLQPRKTATARRQLAERSPRIMAHDKDSIAVRYVPRSGLEYRVYTSSRPVKPRDPVDFIYGEPVAEQYAAQVSELDERQIKKRIGRLTPFTWSTHGKKGRYAKENLLYLLSEINEALKD